MEYDVQKEARVWQRVQEGKQTAPRQGEMLQALIQEQLQLSAIYMYLSRKRPGQSSTALMRLARQARSQAACLQGIFALSGEATAPYPSVPLQSGAADHTLRCCYEQELRLLKEYESRCADSQFGPVYTALARRTRETCCTLAELTGIAAAVK